MKYASPLKKMGYKKNVNFRLSSAPDWRPLDGGGTSIVPFLEIKKEKERSWPWWRSSYPYRTNSPIFMRIKKRTWGKRVCRWDYFCCSFFVGLKCLQRSCCQKVTEGLKWKGTLPFSFAFFSRVPPFSLALVSFDQVETYIAPPSAATL